MARRGSQSATAKNGGAYDWTTAGSLVSKEIDQAVFTLPVGRMSQVIESDRGFHIVRVIDRKEAGLTPFTEAQVDIRKKLKEESWIRQRKAYLDKIRPVPPRPSGRSTTNRGGLKTGAGRRVTLLRPGASGDWGLLSEAGALAAWPGTSSSKHG